MTHSFITSLSRRRDGPGAAMIAPRDLSDVRRVARVDVQLRREARAERFCFAPQECRGGQMAESRRSRSHRPPPQIAFSSCACCRCIRARALQRCETLRSSHTARWRDFSCIIFSFTPVFASFPGVAEAILDKYFWSATTINFIGPESSASQFRPRALFSLHHSSPLNFIADFSLLCCASRPFP